MPDTDTLDRATRAAGTSIDADALNRAYIYLLGRALVVRQELMDKGQPGFAYNQIKYNPLGSADFVNPNFDVSYLEAWVAVDPHTPAILEVPEVDGRYYTAQILDEWGEVIANVNERTMPSKPFGRFALVHPGSAPRLPDDVGRIELHSAKAKLLGRVELKGDPDAALALQQAFKLSSTGTPSISPPPSLAMFGNAELIGVELFDQADAILESALDVSPVAAKMQQAVRAIGESVAIGSPMRAEADRLIRETVVPSFKLFVVTKIGIEKNGWVAASGAGNYGADFRYRSAVNFGGIWANTPDEVIYFVGAKDSDGRPLDGSNNYLIHFAADSLPDKVVDAYWSVILVDTTDYRVVPNDLKRYNFNNHSPLAKEADGSLKISIGARPVEGVPESNWLPAAPDKPFSLTFRTYVPREAVRSGGWAPPTVTRIS